jgi:hypothetical protein
VILEPNLLPRVFHRLGLLGAVFAVAWLAWALFVEMREVGMLLRIVAGGGA